MDKAVIPLIETRAVSRRFGERRQGWLQRQLQARGWSRPPAITHALDKVDLKVLPGEVVGLVGESGCGKSTLGRVACGLLDPSDGQVLVNGRDRASLNSREEAEARLQVQMIFQNPYASLNPRLRIDQIVGEAAQVNGKVEGDLDDYVCQQLLRAGLDPALRDRYPHQFSGGQRQRIGIARALALQPKLIVGDEPVSALDVSIQAQVLNLMLDLQKEMGLAYLFISHNLAVVEHISHRIAVMYLGRIVEATDKTTLFTRALHPYTEQLLLAVPVPDPRVKRQKRVLQGDVPSPVNPPSGCHFHTRCPYVVDRCRAEAPALREVRPGQLVACHLR